MLPALLVLFLILVIRALTLDGAAEGLNAFFKPNWDSILNGKVWVAAYSQIFFSLSIGFAIMVTYSSYLAKKSDITNNAFITGFANSGFELLAGIGVFSILGFMAMQQGVGSMKSSAAVWGWRLWCSRKLSINFRRSMDFSASCSLVRSCWRE